MRLSLFAVVALLVPASSTSVRADEPAKPMPELKVLEQIIGAWDEVVTQKPAEWTPQGGTQKAVSKKTWALGGKFLRMDGTWAPEKIEFVSYLTYDPATKEYRHWYFDSGDSFPRGTVRGTWDEKTLTLTWTGTDESGNKSVGKTKIIDKDTHEWTVVVTDPNGKLMLDLHSKNTRRKE